MARFKGALSGIGLKLFKIFNIETGIIEDEDLQALCYESLKDIFPGNGKKIVQRSKVWKIIQQSLKVSLLKHFFYKPLHIGLYIFVVYLIGSQFYFTHEPT